MKIVGGVPKGYEATEYRRVKQNELYLVIGVDRNYPMKWSCRNDSLNERIILVKNKQDRRVINGEIGE